MNSATIHFHQSRSRVDGSLAAKMKTRPALQHSSRAIAVHSIVVLITAAGLLSDNPAVPLFLGGLLITPAFIVLGILEGRSAAIKITPLSFFFFWNAISLGISALYMGSRISSGEWIDFSVALIPPADLAQGYLIYLLGALAMHVGLQCMRPLPQPLVVKRPANPELSSFVWLVTIWGAGLLYLLKQEWFSFLGTVVQPLHWAALSAVTIFVLVPRAYFGISQWAFGPLAAIGLLGILVANLATGSKAYIMFSFLPIIWAVLMRRDLRRRGMILAVGLLLTYFGVLAPTLQNSRQRTLRTGESYLTHIINSTRILGLSSAEEENSISDEVDRFLVRQFDPIPTGFLVGEVRKDGFQWGQTMQYAAYAFVPRLLWPDKPNVTRGAWFTMYLGASAREAESTSSTGITAIGELYWNFGLVGVVVGMLAIGLGYGLLWRMAGENPVYKPLHMVLYVTVVIGGMTDLPEFITVCAGVLSQVLVFGAVFNILAVGRRNLRAH
jgi:hypothetical protein